MKMPQRRRLRQQTELRLAGSKSVFRLFLSGDVLDGGQHARLSGNADESDRVQCRDQPARFRTKLGVLIPECPLVLQSGDHGGAIGGRGPHVELQRGTPDEFGATVAHLPFERFVDVDVPPSARVVIAMAIGLE